MLLRRDDPELGDRLRKAAAAEIRRRLERVGLGCLFTGDVQDAARLDPTEYAPGSDDRRAVKRAAKIARKALAVRGVEDGGVDGGSDDDFGKGNVIEADADEGVQFDHVTGPQRLLKLGTGKGTKMIKSTARAVAVAAGLDWRLLSKGQKQALQDAVRGDLARGVDPLARPAPAAPGTEAATAALAKLSGTAPVIGERGDIPAVDVHTLAKRVGEVMVPHVGAPHGFRS